MYYTIYKTTNVINGKYYIGKHQTKNLNDSYMGSGKLLKQAIKKYGTENFIKEILYVFETEEEMNAKEKELVILEETSYNLCIGGHGGFSYINSNGIKKFHGRKHTEKTKEKLRILAMNNKNGCGKIPWNKGKGSKSKIKNSRKKRILTEEHKERIRKSIISWHSSKAE